MSVITAPPDRLSLDKGALEGEGREQYLRTLGQCLTSISLCLGKRLELVHTESTVPTELICFSISRVSIRKATRVQQAKNHCKRNCKFHF